MLMVDNFLKRKFQEWISELKHEINKEKLRPGQVSNSKLGGRKANCSMIYLVDKSCMKI